MMEWKTSSFEAVLARINFIFTEDDSETMPYNISKLIRLASVETRKKHELFFLRVVALLKRILGFLYLLVLKQCLKLCISIVVSYKIEDK